MCSLIALKFGKNKEHIRVNSGTEFGMNLVSIQCVRSNDSRKNDWFVDQPTGLTTDGIAWKLLWIIVEVPLVVEKSKEFLLQSNKAITK